MSYFFSKNKDPYFRKANFIRLIDYVSNQLKIRNYKILQTFY